MYVNFCNDFKELIAGRIVAAHPECADLELPFETPPQPEMGHIALPCFALAATLRRSPQKIATELLPLFDDCVEFSSVAVVGGYLNFSLSYAHLAEQLLPAVADRNYGRNSHYEQRCFMVEYSAPNTNKPLHLGHCRNGLLGRAVIELLRFCDAQVISVNLINDRGVHIAKSMLAYERFGDGQTPQSTEMKGDHFVGKYYVRYAQEERINPELGKEAQSLLKAWEDGDEAVRALWKKMNQWVLAGFEETYARMGDVFDRVYYESETYAGGKEIVQNALQKGVCTTKENGAVAIDLEEYGLGEKILLRSDGTGVYITQDISTAINKFHDYPLTNCIYVVGSEQENHFRVLFAVLEKLGYPWAGQCEHLSYGMVELPEGKMKSREGTVVDLDNLLDAMRDLALESLQEREQNKETPRGSQQLLQLAEAIGQAAIRFFILKTNNNQGILFDPKQSLSFEGMTGPYLQYTFARINTLRNRAGSLCTEADKHAEILLDGEWQPAEGEVLVMLMRFPDIVLQGALARSPAVLTRYAYELCKTYNRMYYELPILRVEDKRICYHRLILSRAVQQVLKKCMILMSIEIVREM